MSGGRRELRPSRSLGKNMLYAAHETKTALSVIDVILTLIQRELERGRAPDPADLETARAALRRASSLLEEVLAYGGVRPVALAPVDLNELVRSVASMLRVMARGATPSGRGAVQIVERHSPEPCVIQADRVLLEASLINLAFNSLQALGSRGGTVWLEVRPGQRMTEIRIRDTGPGFGNALPEGAALPYRTMRPGGTGLGLPIARTGIEAHRGTLTLCNRDEGGAEAIVRIPTNDHEVTSSTHG